MVLQFQTSCRPRNGVEPNHTQDDFFIHATRVAQVQVDYFEWDKGEALLRQTWRLATVAKDYVVDGRRKENVLWRTWFQQRLGLKKIDPSVIEWEKLEDVSALCGPVVLSREICYSWTASQDAVEVEARPVRPPMDRLPSSKRGVLRQPQAQYPFPSASRGCSPETSKSRSLSSGSDSSTPAPHTPPARVAFSGWVARGLILEEPTFYSSPDTTPSSEDGSTAASVNPVGWVALDAVVLAKEPQARFRCQQGPPIVWLEPEPETSSDDPVEEKALIRKRGRGLQRSRSFFNFYSSSAYKDDKDMDMDNVPHLRHSASADTGTQMRSRRTKAKFLLGG